MKSNKEIRENLSALVRIYTETRTAGKTPDETVIELENAIGPEAARQTVAELVNLVGDWDGRVYDYVREWAAGVDGATPGERMNAMYIYQPSEIHPAHINQIGSSGRKRWPN